MSEKVFSRKGAKVQRTLIETRQRFASLRLCVKPLLSVQSHTSGLKDLPI
jgi:hypothetical protein